MRAIEDTIGAALLIVVIALISFVPAACDQLIINALK